jgi:hypothetical protein
VSDIVVRQKDGVILPFEALNDDLFDVHLEVCLGRAVRFVTIEKGRRLPLRSWRATRRLFEHRVSVGASRYLMLVPRRARRVD